MPVKHTNKMKGFIRNVTQKKAPQVLNAIGSAAGIRGDAHTPIAYSTLINSRFMNVFNNGSTWVLELGYNTAYAARLHNNTDWSPRRPPKYGQDGSRGGAVIAPAQGWNPDAKPFWLRDAFESQESKQDIQKTIKAIMSV